MKKGKTSNIVIITESSIYSVSADDSYTKNNIQKNAIKVEYKKEDLAQVNPQLCKWLAIINAQSSNNSIPDNESTVNTKSMQKTENYSETEDNEGDQFAVGSPFDSYSYKKKSIINEFNTNVMQWAYSAATKSGDIKIFAKSGVGFVLVEATDDGYIEFNFGNYKEMRELEQQYREPDNSIHVYTEIVRNAKRGNISGNVSFENRGEYEQGGRQTGSEKFQTDSTGNNEHLRSSDKGIDESNDEFVKVLLMRAVKNAPNEQHNRWYIIEKFDDVELGYRIMKKLNKKQYEELKGEIDDVRDRKGASIEGTSVRINGSAGKGIKFARRNNYVDSNSNEYTGKNNQVQRVGSGQSQFNRKEGNNGLSNRESSQRYSEKLGNTEVFSDGTDQFAIVLLMRAAKENTF